MSIKKILRESILEIAGENKPKGKDIFVPRNNTRFDDLKQEWIKKGYKDEEIHIGNVRSVFYRKIDPIIENTIKVILGDVNIMDSSLTKLPFKVLEIVTGNFNCSENKLEKLDGAPKWVGGYFDCAYNDLISLDYVPQYIGDWFDCTMNSDLDLDRELEKLGHVGTKINSDLDRGLEGEMDESVKAKDIFVPRNQERFDDLKAPFIKMGYKPEEILVGNLDLIDIRVQTFKVPIKVIIGGLNLKYCNLQYGTLKDIGANKIDIVTGNFNIAYNSLTSIVDCCPKQVYGDFLCFHNLIVFTIEDVEKECVVKGNTILN